MSRVDLSRRGFGRTLGAATIAASIPAVAPAAQHASGHRSNYYQFPDGFQWGCATAAYQVEGGAGEDGRGKSIWDTFAHTPGKVYRGQTGDTANDDYHRYKEDLQLLKELSAKSYRFSVSWPRIFPQGTGQINTRGIDHYDRVVDEMLKQGIEPYGTLFHWDLPQALQDKVGGWESRETAEAFAVYAGVVAGKLSDRVKHFFTINEFSSFIDLGYAEGRFAPGLKLDTRRVNQAKHNAVLAHGLAVQAIRAKAQPGTKVGLAENFANGVPVVQTEEHIKAAKQATRVLNAPYLTAVLEGRYIDEYLQAAGAAAPKFTAADMKAVGSPLDFVGANVYTPTYVRADDNTAGFSVVPDPQSYPHMASSWLTVGPEALYWAPRHLTDLWGVKEIYITENGTSSLDVLAANGHIWDTDRVMFLKAYLVQLHRAVSEGCPVRGYFLWSLMDNFEWADGYSKRFGIYYVDFETQKRFPKLSASFYKETIARNALA